MTTEGPIIPNAINAGGFCLPEHGINLQRGLFPLSVLNDWLLTHSRIANGAVEHFLELLNIIRLGDGPAKSVITII
jgi:hypothetical protein